MLINIFLNLVQMRVTREASSRIYVILHMHFWRVLVFLIYLHVLQQAYEIPGYFDHTCFLKFKKFRKKFPENFVRETAEKRSKKRKSNASMPLPINLVASDFVFASAPHLFFSRKKKVITASIDSPKYSRCGPIFQRFCEKRLRNAWCYPPIWNTV